MVGRASPARIRARAAWISSLLSLARRITSARLSGDGSCGRRLCRHGIGQSVAATVRRRANRRPVEPVHLDHRMCFTHVGTGRRHSPARVSGLDGYRATPASCLCIAAASVASFADSRSTVVTRRSQCTAACAIFVPRYVFAVATCSLASAVYRLANVRKYSSRAVVIGGCARLGRHRVEFLIGRRRRACASLEAGAGRRRRRCGTGSQFLVVGCELTQLSRRLRIEIRELLAVRAHAGPKIAAWVANEALRHRRVPLGFGRIALSESGEVRSEARVVARLCSFDELLHLECVQKRGGFVLCCGAPREQHRMRAQEAIVNGSGAFS